MEALQYFLDKLKTASPFIFWGVVGGIVHRFRNRMSWAEFLKTLFISVFVSYCTGVFFRDYMKI